MAPAPAQATAWGYATFPAGETRFGGSVFSPEVDVAFDQAEFSGGKGQLQMHPVPRRPARHWPRMMERL
jgi:hypothetical protein